MEPVTAIMLLLSCNDDLGMCREAARSASHYASVEICEDDLLRQMKSAGDGPQRIGQCLALEPSQDPRSVKLRWHLTRAGDLVATVEAEPAPTQLAEMAND